MPSPFRSLLYLYPAAFREEYGEEMMTVLSAVKLEIQRKGSLARAFWYAHEAGGLVCGAMQEHSRSLFAPERFPTFPQRRLTMRSEFRFPKATVTLMTIILAAVMYTIEKAKAISESIPQANPPVGPIQPEQFTIVTTFLVVMAGVCGAAALVWAVLFALKRSGTQRLADLNPSAGQHSGISGGI
jgi:hypothetical protein